MTKKIINQLVKIVFLGFFIGFTEIVDVHADEPLPTPVTPITPVVPVTIAPDSPAVLEPEDLSLLDFESAECRAQVPTSSRSLEVRNRLLGTISQPGAFRRELVQQGFRPGDPVYFRIFKQTQGPEKGLTGIGHAQLEAWMLPKGAQEYRLFKTYPIVAWGGALGPKLKEGDGQSPEGFYSIVPEALNPLSQFHLSMNLGFPNPYDKNLERTGSFVMIHGGSQSGGCFVFSFPDDEELYVLAEAALMRCAGEVPVAVFPFPLSESHLKQSADLPWVSFWENLAEGYRLFEGLHRPPKVGVSEGRYLFREP